LLDSLFLHGSCNFYFEIFYCQGPFDVCRKVFAGGEETAHMTLIDKSDLFFQDYSFGPLFVQENYIHCNPYAARLGLILKFYCQWIFYASSFSTVSSYFVAFN
jgi:hypothetical protein